MAFFPRPSSQLSVCRVTVILAEGALGPVVDMAHTNNLVLDSLPETERDGLLRRFEQINLDQHQVLFELDEPVTRVYFPIDVVVSLVVPLSTGERVESAIIGRDGILGAGAALAERNSLNRAVALFRGRAFVCSATHLKALMGEHPHIRTMIYAHEQALFAQAQQSAACFASHSAESRLARWLLRAADLHGGDQLDLTQEYLAEMLGVRRTSVSLIARTLQRARMIRYNRGHIRLASIKALRATACECYDAVKMNYDAFLRRPPDV